jgi:anti-sigma-K factor RskA
MAEHNQIPSQSCKAYEQDLVLYYYGELAEDELRRTEVHLRECNSCRQTLESLRSLLPLTVKEDHPPQSFWDDYSRELRGKLDQVEAKESWRDRFVSLIRPWPVPAAATAIVILLALTLTLHRTLWRPEQAPPVNGEIFEIIRMTDDVEFYKNLDLLDSMDLLEVPGTFSNGSESA